MKNIIAYSMEKLYKDLEEADELFLSSGMKDMELYEKQLAEAARKAAAEHMAALYSDMDRMLCEDISRAEKYIIQRHDERQLLTTVGPVCFTHTLFRSRKDGTCHYLLDEWMELDAHERLSSRAEAEVLAEAVKTSYASAARVLGEDSLISKTAVMDKVHGIQTELPFPKPEKKKCVEYLYVEADEDHIHKQEVTGTEGISVSLNRGYMTRLLHHQHDNDRVYIEKMQATIASIDIGKSLQSEKESEEFDKEKLEK